MGKLFGTDGVRGIANKELTPELAFKLGWAATTMFGKECRCQPQIVIGRDTRISGPMLEAALAAGICAAGGKAILAGVVPTPAVAFFVRRFHAQCGVVISASHNPFADNGIKFFASTGYKLPDAVEEELENLALEGVAKQRPVAEKVGTIEYRHDLLKEYIDYVVSSVPENRFAGLKLVLDCSNGAAYEAGPVILRRLGAEVIVLHNRPNGVNINDDCGSTHMESLQEAVVAAGAQLGIAYDGDADRCLAVDERGELVDGDQIMVICALALLKEGKLKDNTLVATVMSNLGLHRAIRNAGGMVQVTPVGDRYVLELMQECGLSLGGEQSGHIIFKEYSTTGDGLVTSVQLIAALLDSGKPLSELGRAMTRYPQLLQNVRVRTKEGWADNLAIKQAIDAAEGFLGEDGRILVRPSGTEPLIRVMAEGPDADALEKLVNDVAAVILVEQGA